MSDPDKPPSLEDLGDRIAKIRHEAGLEAQDQTDDKLPPPTGLGLAWRISIELVVAVVVCTGLGWLLDQWFGSTPWLMLVFLFLGGAAGTSNAVRTANRMDAEAAEKAAEGRSRDAGVGGERGTPQGRGDRLG